MTPRVSGRGRGDNRQQTMTMRDYADGIEEPTMPGAVEEQLCTALLAISAAREAESLEEGERQTERAVSSLENALDCFAEV
jgi:hypothetical protein